MTIHITSGPTGSALKLGLFGPEGVGKSSLAHLIPGGPVLFVDTEGSTDDYNFQRIGCTNWKDVDEATAYLLNESHPYRTVVYDTMSAWEKFAEAKILLKDKKTRMADFHYGRGSLLMREETDMFLFGLDPLVRKGINVILIAHSSIKRLQPPEHPDGYDRYELSLDARAAASIKRWTKALLFLNYRSYVITTEEKKTRGMGGDKRVIYTRHQPQYDAKNRHDLPAEIPFEKGIWPAALNALFSAPIATDSDQELFAAFCEAVKDIQPEVLKTYLVERGEVKPEDDARAIRPEFLQLVVDNTERFKEQLAEFAKLLQPTA